MAWTKNMAIKGYNAKITDASDGKRQKMTDLADKNLWIPALRLRSGQASAGMTMLVGGNSH